MESNVQPIAALAWSQPLTRKEFGLLISEIADNFGPKVCEETSSIHYCGRGTVAASRNPISEAWIRRNIKSHCLKSKVRKMKTPALCVIDRSSFSELLGEVKRIPIKLGGEERENCGIGITPNQQWRLEPKKDKTEIVGRDGDCCFRPLPRGPWRWWLLLSFSFNSNSRAASVLCGPAVSCD